MYIMDGWIEVSTDTIRLNIRLSKNIYGSHYSPFLLKTELDFITMIASVPYQQSLGQIPL